MSDDTYALIESVGADGDIPKLALIILRRLVAKNDAQADRIAELEALLGCSLTNRRHLVSRICRQSIRIAELEAQVSAWPVVPSADEERDPGTALECAEVGR